MRTMIWKEWRENLKWAVLAMLALALAEFYGLNAEHFGRMLGHYSYTGHATETLTNPSFLMMTTFGSAAVGLLLALVQFLPEQRRDQWAALLHRPVERALVFRGKVAAGLALYLLATVPPFLAAAWYVATPGHFPSPFLPGMLRPGLADIVAGTMYYLAGALVVLQRGSWFGIRAAVLLAAVSVSGFVAVVSNFRVALEAAVAVALAFGIAAGGAMAVNGPFRPRPFLARAALLAAVFYGVAEFGSLTLVCTAVLRNDPNQGGRNIVFSEEGAPLLIRTMPDYSRKVTGLDGQVVTDPRYAGEQLFQHILYPRWICAQVGKSPLPSPIWGDGIPSYREGSTYWRLVQGGGEQDPEHWYLLRGRDLFVGYAGITRRSFAWFGRDGFVRSENPPAAFEGRMKGEEYGRPMTYRFGEKIYAVDFEGHAMRQVFDGTGLRIAGVTNLVTTYDVQTQGVAVALDDAVRVVGLDGARLAELPYHRDVARWGQINVTMNKAEDRFYRTYSPSSWILRAERRTMPVFLEELDRQGVVLHAYAVAPEPERPSPRPWTRFFSEGWKAPALYLGDLVYEKAGAVLGSERLRQRLARRLGENGDETRETLLLLSLFSLASALAAFVLARRARFRPGEVRRWTLFCLLFNVAGLIAFRLVADWPVLAKCPACGKPRRVDDAECPHCGTAWPAPERDGTEIFDAGRQEAALS